MFPRSSFLQKTGPWLKEKTVWGRIFFKIEEKRKIGNFPEQLRNSFPEKFCCKLDTKTLLSRFPIFIFLPYKGKFFLSVGNLLDKQCLLFWLFIFKVEMINKMYNFCWLLKFWFPRFVDFPAASPIWVIAFLALGLHHHHHHLVTLTCVDTFFLSPLTQLPVLCVIVSSRNKLYLCIIHKTETVKI